ncbi:MAG: AAA family ATPase [Bacteroidales bacterium]|nr:AAA family ATPase [Bacteroidales bacterium]
MAIPVLIIGKSGAGKSASMAKLDPSRVALISVLGKPLPFRGKFDQIATDDYAKVIGAIKATKRDIVVVDDAGYLMTNMFMKDHANAGQGNAVFNLYNNIGDKFWNMIESIRKIPENKRVYIIMHEDQNEFGSVKPKSIGRMIDEKVCLEGMFTIVLRCMVQHGKHIFRTQSDGLDVAKTPMGMFEAEEIPNDLKAVDDTICAYYEIGGETK